MIKFLVIIGCLLSFTCNAAIKVKDNHSVKLIKTRTLKIEKHKEYTRDDINQYIKIASIKHKVPEKLIHAVILTESNYNRKAISSAGAVGLMQLMPATAMRFGVTNRFDPRQNINGGVQYLKYLLNMFKSTPLAVAGYNAGEHSIVDRQIPNYPETKNYVKLVMERVK